MNEDWTKLAQTLKDLALARFKVILTETQVEDAFRWATVLHAYTGDPMLPEISAVAIAIALYRPRLSVIGEAHETGRPAH
jgi:hypothetical protein